MVRFSAAHIQSIYPTAASIYISNSIKSEKESLIKKDLYKNKKLITEKTGIAAEYIARGRKIYLPPNKLIILSHLFYEHNAATKKE